MSDSQANEPPGYIRIDFDGVNISFHPNPLPAAHGETITFVAATPLTPAVTVTWEPVKKGQKPLFERKRFDVAPGAPAELVVRTDALGDYTLSGKPAGQQPSDDESLLGGGRIIVTNP